MYLLDFTPATEEECCADWGGYGPGVRFRCGLCGHKFVVGDLWKLLYTNDLKTPNAYGNPFVCKSCDDENDKLIEKWIDLCTEWNELVDNKFWFFVR